MNICIERRTGQSTCVQKLVLTLFIWFLAAPVMIRGDDSLPLLLVTQGNVENIGEYADLTADVCGSAFADSGIHVIQPAEMRDASYPIQHYVDTARGVGSTFLVINTISKTGEVISIDTQFFYTLDGELLYESSSKGSINLGLQRKLEFFAEKILEAALNILKTRGLARVYADRQSLIVEAAPDTASEEVNISESTQNAAATDVATTESETKSADAGSVAAPAESSSPSEEPRPPVRATAEDHRTPGKMRFKTGAAATVPFGRADRYLSTGVSVSNALSYLIVDKAVALDVGLVTQTRYFHAEGSLRSSDNIVIKGGVSSGARIFTGGNLIPFVGIFGGMGILGVNGPEDVWLWKPVPWAGVSTGVGIALNSGNEVSLTCDIDALFESSLLMLTLAPGIGWRISW